MILPLQGKSSPPDIWQQAEHSLREYELDDEALQTAQLEQHKIVQNFPTNPALVAPSAPPLPEGTYPQVSPLIEPNDSGNDSLKTPFNIKSNNTFLNNNNYPLLYGGSLNCWLCNHRSLKLMVFPPFQS